MRIYIAGTTLDLGAEMPPNECAIGVTADLRNSYPDPHYSEEDYEALAMDYAAAISLNVICETASAHPRRVVFSADVDNVTPSVNGIPPVEGKEDAPISLESGNTVIPGRVDVVEELTWDNVASIHIDEVEAETDLASIIAGDNSKLDDVERRSLLWFDITERAALMSEFSA